MQPLLFVGDPHISSLTPARRIDDYAAACLDKLQQCVQLANRLRARMVILGDLFDRPRESDIGLLYRLIDVFKGAQHGVLCLAGNHDKSGQHLTSDTTLALLAHAGVLEAIDQIQRIEMPSVTLHCVPYGHPIPTQVERSAGLSVMITHHDLAIAPNGNPHALPPHPIEGCDLVVNGHDHTAKPPMRVGPTLYVNPGNISRVSVAQLHHRPSVVALLPPDAHDIDSEPALFDAKPGQVLLTIGDGWRLCRYELLCASGESVFDLTGYNTKASSSDDALADYLAELGRSSQEKFVRALAATGELQAAGSGQAVIAVVRQVMHDMNVDDEVRQIIEQHILGEPLLA